MSAEGMAVWDPAEKPFEYRPPIETCCGTCGNKFIGMTCPRCGEVTP